MLSVRRFVLDCSLFNCLCLASTQTISDSYDDQEPTQPMKIWNGNPANGKCS